MATDNDLAALMPSSPPARPAQREAAIEEALRRFDAGGPAAPPARVKARPAPLFEGWGRPQVAAFASLALVVLVSVPIWWARDQIAPDTPPSTAEFPPAAAPAPAPQPPQRSVAVDLAPVRAEPETPASPAARVPTPASPGMDLNLAPPPASFADAPPPAMAGQAQAKPAPAPPAAPAARRAAAAADSEQGIVVTGSRVSRPNYEANSASVSVSEETLAGDWDKCTLRDPRRDASACRAFADPSAPGDTGRAAAQVADGLTLAWRGDLDRAIDVFDRAIRAAPDSSIAYLNRGLAWQEKGDLNRALGDLNRAVARDPGSGRAYYHRSRLHRARGDTARAEADARRAAELGAR